MVNCIHCTNVMGLRVKSHCFGFFFFHLHLPVLIYRYLFIYLFVGATDWCKRWKKNGWKTVNGTEVKNKVEFQKLTKLCDEIDVKWVCFIDLKKVYCR